MDRQSSRREFLASSALAGAGLLAAGRAVAAPFKTTLRKAMIISKPTEKNLRPLKDAGFDGVEARGATVEQAAQCRAIAEKLGLRIHSVMGGGSPAGLRTAKAYGADAVLHVPGRVKAKAMPQPWEFDLEFDDKNGHLLRVVKGDNAPYKDYIAAHDRNMDSARAYIQRILPVAEETKVVIALENVWNNFCPKPGLFKWLIESFQSPWVKAYFDVGNHVKYITPPEEWIRTLGPLVAKVHIKDYLLAPDGKKGNWAKIGEGSVNWPTVRQALEGVGYSGWITNESGGLSLPELNKRFDLIIAGKDPCPGKP